MSKTKDSLNLSIEPMERRNPGKGESGFSSLSIDASEYVVPHNEPVSLKLAHTEVDAQEPEDISVVTDTQPIIPIIKKGVTLGSGAVVEQIGQGGMTKVYKIWNEELEMFRAIKLMNHSLNQDAFERFKTEAKICAKFDHQNVVHIFSIGKWYDIPYIEMEYIDGHSLDHYIRNYGRIPYDVATAISVEISKALDHIHTHHFTLYGEEYNGIIHRDLKPSNIMIGNDGSVKLMDFGIARPVERGFHTAIDGNVVGTIQYFSPEQLDNDKIDHRTDIYAFGAILYEMLTGNKTFPFTTLTSLVKMKTINSFKEFREYDFPLRKELKEVSSTCLKTKREQRYETAHELYNTLISIYRTISSENPSLLVQRYTNDPQEQELKTEEFPVAKESMDIFEQAQSKSLLPIILGGLGTLALIGLIVFMVMK